jgi:hypothetical protein
MRGWLIGLSFVSIMASGDPSTSPEEVLTRFYRASIAGERLGENAPVTVIRDFVVKRNRVGTKEAAFTVDILVVGVIQPSLQFVRREGQVPFAPARAQRYYRLTRDGDGWHMGAVDVAPLVGVDAAIRYVADRGSRTSDAAVKVNADRTVATLKRLAAGEPAQPPVAIQATPTRVVETFAKTAPQRGSVTVVKEMAVGNADITDDDKAAVRVEYGPAVGILTLETARLEAGAFPSDGPSSYDDVHLALVESVSKIEEPIPMRRMTVETAMRYVTSLRDTTTVPGIKRQVDRTLARLKQLTLSH